MKGYKQLSTKWDREMRNEENRMYSELYNEIGDVVQNVTNQVIDDIADMSKLHWLPTFVETYEDIATVYPNPSEGDTTMAKSDSTDYPTGPEDKRSAGTIWRYDGIEWLPVQNIDPSAISGLETVVNNKIGDLQSLETTVYNNLVGAINSNAADLNHRGVNALLHGVVGDGITDDTQAIQDVINNNSYIVFPIPEESFTISDEIVVPSNRTLEFIGGNHWNPNNQREVRFRWIGDEEPTKAMFRLAKSPAEQEPTVDTSNVKFKGGCVLDGDGKAGYGFCAAFITNESSFEKITVINTLTDGFKVDKSWYASFRDITAKGNFGNGITIGRNGWGSVNGCLIENLRGHSNGRDGSFTEENYASSYGVGLWLGSGTTAHNVVSEQNYGAGLVYGMGRGSVNKVDTVYLEKNGLQAKIDGKTHRNWGLIVDGKPGMSAISLENIYLARSTGDPEVQSIWLTGEKPSKPIELRNVALGQHLKAEWDEYKLTGYISSGMSLHIEGHLPKVSEGTFNSNWNTLYVSSNGSDENDGRTSGTAFATLVKAIEKTKAINTITTIIVTGNLVHEVVDFSGINREITIDGQTTASISGSSNNNNGLRIENAKNIVNVNNFNEITRLIITNCFRIKTINTNFGHTDGAFNGTMEVVDSNLLIDSCDLDGNLATNAVKNGIRLYNSVTTIKEMTISGYGDNYFSISEGGRIYADIYIPTFYYTNWVDGSGLIQGGDKMSNSVGSVTFS